MVRTKLCRACGNGFSVKPSHYDIKTYCCRACMAADYKQRMAGSENPNFRDAGRQSCKQCGDGFASYQKQSYCSLECRNASPDYIDAMRMAALSRPPLTKTNRPKKRRQLVREWRECVFCKCGFVCWPSQKKATCSQQCNLSHTSERQKGSKSHRWRGGKTEEAKLVRSSAAYADWRKSVFCRDDYTCQLCGLAGGKLAAHHIKEFSTHPDLRLDVANGVTLCWPCHFGFKGKESIGAAYFSVVARFNTSGPWWNTAIVAVLTEVK